MNRSRAEQRERETTFKAKYSFPSSTFRWAESRTLKEKVEYFFMPNWFQHRPVVGNGIGAHDTAILSPMENLSYVSEYQKYNSYELPDSIQTL